jgi:hypothetical protein
VSKGAAGATRLDIFANKQKELGNLFLFFFQLRHPLIKYKNKETNQ